MLYDALSQWWGELEHPTPSAEQQKRNASFFVCTEARLFAALLQLCSFGT